MSYWQNGNSYARKTNLPIVRGEWAFVYVDTMQQPQSGRSHAVSVNLTHTTMPFESLGSSHIMTTYDDGPYFGVQDIGQQTYYAKLWLDKVRLFNRALTTQEREALYNEEF